MKNLKNIELKISQKEINQQLFYACRHGDVVLIEKLLSGNDSQESADLYAKNECVVDLNLIGFNVLMYACHYYRLGIDNKAIINYLILDKKMKVDEATLDWLGGKNHYDFQYRFDYVLKLIKIREANDKLSQKLDNEKYILNKVKKI